MPFNCIVYGCSLAAKEGERTLFGFPKDAKSASAWSKFVCRTRKDWKAPTSSSKICSEHFKKEDLANRYEFEMKLVKWLRLVPGAVPTIYPEGTCQSLSGTGGRSSGNDNTEFRSAWSRRRATEQVSNYT